MKQIVIIAFFVLLLSGIAYAGNIGIGNDKPTVKYNFDSSETCLKGKCTLTIGGQEYADENGTLIQNAKSLKDCQYCNNIKINLAEDKINYPVRILDYNYTKMKICFSVGLTQTGKDIPLAIYNKYNKSETSLSTNLRISTIWNEYCSELDFGLDKELKWGSASTLITINRTNNGIKEDLTVYDSAFKFGFQIKVNISIIPQNKKIENVKYCANITYIQGTQDKDCNIRRVKNQTWTEATSATNIQSMAVDNLTTKHNWTQITLKKTACINTTIQIEADYNESHTYSTMRFIDPDAGVGTISSTLDDSTLYFGYFSTNYVGFIDRENSGSGGVTRTPYFNITYSDIQIHTNTNINRNNTVAYLNLSQQNSSYLYNLNWKTDVGFGFDSASPSVCNNGRCFVKSQAPNGKLWAINSTNGIKLWNVSKYGDWGTTIYNHKVYLSYADNGDSSPYGQVAVLNETNGQQLCLLNSSALNNSLGNIIIYPTKNIGIFVNGYWYNTVNVTEKIVAFNLTNCTDVVYNVTLWHSAKRVITTTLSYAEDRIFLMMSDTPNPLIMINASTGQVIDNLSLNALSIPIFEYGWDYAIPIDEGNNLLYVPSYSGIHIINYSNNILEEELTIPIIPYDSRSNTISWWKDYLVTYYQDTDNGKIIVVNKTNGKGVCNVTEDIGYTHSSSAVPLKNGLFYSLYEKPKEGVMLFNVTNCKVLWKYNLVDSYTGNISAGGMVLYNGNMYPNSPKTYFNSFDVGNGTGQWNTSFGLFNRTSKCWDCVKQYEYVKMNCTNKTQINFTCTIKNLYNANVTGINLTLNKYANWYNKTNYKYGTNKINTKLNISLNKGQETIIRFYLLNNTLSSCICPDPQSQWLLDFSDNCDITNCDIGNYNIITTGTGNIRCMGNITAQNLSGLDNLQNLYIFKNCTMKWTG